MSAELCLGILAGGEGRRFGGVDKGWLTLQGQSLIERLLQRVCPTGPVLISANRHLDQYRALGHPVLPDADLGQGPMGGVQTLWQASTQRYLCLLPVDAVDWPENGIERLLQALQCSEAALAVARVGADWHYPCVMLDRQRLRGLPPSRGSLRAWIQSEDSVAVDFPVGSRFSLNTPAELAAA